MDADKDNANPTIINPSDLPSRRRDTAATAAAKQQKRSGVTFSALTAAYPSLHIPSSTYSEEEPSSPGTAFSSDSDPDTTLPDADHPSSTHTQDPSEPIDEQEVYDLISTISDPEHPLSLGSLGVVTLDDIKIFPPSTSASRISTVRVLITPTTSACSLTTVIGLGVKVRLVNALPPRFRIDVRIKEGTSKTADEVNKQLADKERVAAAMENKSLVSVVNTMLATCQ